MTKQELIDIVEKRAAEKTLGVIESEMVGYYNLATVEAVGRDMCNWFLSLLKDLNTEHPIRWVEPKYTAQETALDAVIQKIAKEKADEEAAFMEAFIARTAVPVEEFSFGDDFWYGSAYGNKDIWKCRKFDWDGNEINYTMILENNKKVAECRILDNVLGHKFECKYYK
jgi:tRNA(Ile)-lysidine synthase TilS/MesJ